MNRKIEEMKLRIIESFDDDELVRWLINFGEILK
jgi:hypothetical protein